MNSQFAAPDEPCDAIVTLRSYFSGGTYHDWITSGQFVSRYCRRFWPSRQLGPCQCGYTVHVLSPAGILLGWNFRGRQVRLGGSCREYWRVVFSSSGDLLPESGAVPTHGVQSHVWLEAALRPLRVVVDCLASVLVPSDCRICNRRLIRLSRLPVCDVCLSSLVRAEDLSCSLCGERLDYLSPEATSLCGVCRRLPPRFDFALSFGAYDGALRKLVHLLKYERLRPAALVLGAKLAEAVDKRTSGDERALLMVPVPLHPSKRRQRGFNQSELIARAALKLLPASRFELHGGNLRRVRATESQTGLTRHQRRENVRGAFVAKFPERLKDRRVLIVDDVYTTGTTLNECARVVRAAGAKQIIVATVARVYRPAAAAKLRDAASNQEESRAVFA